MADRGTRARIRDCIVSAGKTFIDSAETAYDYSGTRSSCEACGATTRGRGDILCSTCWEKVKAFEWTPGFGRQPLACPTCRGVKLKAKKRTAKRMARVVAEATESRSPPISDAPIQNWRMNAEPAALDVSAFTAIVETSAPRPLVATVPLAPIDVAAIRAQVSQEIEQAERAIATLVRLVRSPRWRRCAYER